MAIKKNLFSDTAFCKNKLNKNWYCFNDSTVTKVDSSKIVVRNFWKIEILTFSKY